MSDDCFYLRIKSGIEREQVSSRQGGRTPRYRPVVVMFETTADDPDNAIAGTHEIHQGAWCDTEEEASARVDEFVKATRESAVRGGSTVHNIPLSDTDKVFAPRPELGHHDLFGVRPTSN